MTLVLYAQALPQIEAIYGRETTLAILANCPHQVFFPPKDPQTAEHVSRAYGTRFETIETMSTTGSHFSTAYRPALEVGQLLALPSGKVLVFSQGLTFVTDDNSANVAGWLGSLPPPPAVQASILRRSLAVPDRVTDIVRASAPTPATESEPPARKPARNEHRNRSLRREEPSERTHDDPRERYW